MVLKVAAVFDRVVIARNILFTLLCSRTCCLSGSPRSRAPVRAARCWCCGSSSRFGCHVPVLPTMLPPLNFIKSKNTHFPPPFLVISGLYPADPLQAAFADAAVEAVADVHNPMRDSLHEPDATKKARYDEKTTQFCRQWPLLSVFYFPYFFSI